MSFSRGHAARTGWSAPIITVQVDRVHQRAGSKNVIEMHGAWFDLLCSHCELSTRRDSFDTLATTQVSDVVDSRFRARSGT